MFCKFPAKYFPTGCADWASSAITLDGLATYSTFPLGENVSPPDGPAIKFNWPVARLSVRMSPPAAKAYDDAQTVLPLGGMASELIPIPAKEADPGIWVETSTGTIALTSAFSTYSVLNADVSAIVP